MNVAPVNNTNVTHSKHCARPKFSGEQKATSSQNAEDFFEKVDNMSPLAKGFSSGVIWFGLGLGLDRLTGMFFKSMKSSLKSSLIINAAFGTLIGAISYFKAKNND